MRIPRAFPGCYLSEADVTRQHEIFFIKRKILYFHTKVRGEIHAKGNNQKGFYIKKNPNRGFFDMILVLPGSIFVGLELKSGKGGVVSAHQLEVHAKVISHGGHVIVSNSVTYTEKQLIEKGLLCS